MIECGRRHYSSVLPLAAEAQYLLQILERIPPRIEKSMIILKHSENIVQKLLSTKKLFVDQLQCAVCGRLFNVQKLGYFLIPIHFGFLSVLQRSI